MDEITFITKAKKQNSYSVDLSCDGFLVSNFNSTYEMIDLEEGEIYKVKITRLKVRPVDEIIKDINDL